MSLFGFLSNNLYTNHAGNTKGAPSTPRTSGLSPRLWGQVTGAMMQADGCKRLFLAGDDFSSFHGLLTTTAGDYEGGYKSYQDDGLLMTQAADVDGGVLKMAFDGGADNDEQWLQSGGSTGPLGAISDASGEAFLTAFEVRFKTSTVADDVNALFMGLSEVGAAAADTKVDDTGVMQDGDYIGFDTVHVNGGTAGTNAICNFVYRLNGDTGAVTKIAGLQTLVADTWYKMGFVYNPQAPATQRIKVYVNNVENATKVTAADIAQTTAGSKFPDAQYMSFLAGGKAGAATASNLYVDWWGFAQLIG